MCCFNKKRVTMVVGAGAVLDFQFPASVMEPSTANITTEVRKPYTYPLGTHLIDIPEDIYQRLTSTYGKGTGVDVNFEMLLTSSMRHPN